MVPDQSTFLNKVLPVVKAWGQKSFTGNDRETQTSDAISHAWKIYLTAPVDTKPSQIAYYAIKSVKDNRQFSESTRCVMSPKKRQRKPERQEFEAVFAARDNANPARLVAFKLDFQQWFAELNPRAKEVAELLALGHETQVVAEMLGVTPGAVSQWRRRLESSWYATR